MKKIRLRILLLILMALFWASFCNAQPCIPNPPIGTVEAVKDTIFNSNDSLFIIVPAGVVNQLKRTWGSYSELSPIQMRQPGLYILPMEVVHDSDSLEALPLMNNMLVRKLKACEFPVPPDLINIKKRRE